MAATLATAFESDPDPLVRQAALAGLRARGALPLPLLLDAVRHDDDPAVRLAALDVLRTRGMQDPKIYETVTNLAAADADDAVRTAAATLRRDLNAAGSRPRR